MASHEMQLVPVSKIKLDLENPRFEKADNQNDAIEKIFIAEEKKMLALAKDIASGGVDPSQLPILLKSDDEYIVLEGNRRITCLLLLNSPDRPPLEYRSAFRNISTNLKVQLPKQLSCIVVTKRDDANKWLHDRHTGENGGIGVSAWDTEQQRRFDVKTKGIPDKTLQLVDWFCEKSKHLRDKYRSKAMFTNIERLLDDAQFRALMGLEYKNGQMLAMVSGESLLRAITKIVDDFYNGKTVDEIKGKSNRVKYAEEIKASLPEAKDKIQEPTPLNSLVVEKKNKANNSGGRIKSIMGRNKLVPSGFKFHSDNDKVHEIFYTLTKLDIEKFPVAVSMLFRGFIELSTYHYMQQKGMNPPERGKFIDSWKEVIDTMEKNKELSKDQANAVKITANKDNTILSYNTLHQCVHNKSFFPLPSDLISMWSTLESYVQSIGNLPAKK